MTNVLSTDPRRGVSIMPETIISFGNFALVFCCYREEDVDGSLRFLNEFRKMLPKSEIVAVDTSQKIDLHKDAYKPFFAETMRTSNNNMEFGAYQCGLEFLRTKGNFDDLRGIFFLNDTVGKKNFDFKTNLAYAAFASSVSDTEAVMFGKCDSYGPQSFFIGDLQIRRWISTHLFYVSRSLLERMSFRIAYNLLGEIDNRAPNPIVSLCKETFFAGIDPYLADRLESWLFKGGWHNSAALTSKNYVFFRRKLKSILNEFYISALAQKYGAIVCSNRIISVLGKISESNAFKYVLEAIRNFH